MDLIYFGRTASEFRCDTLTESDRKSASLRSPGAGWTVSIVIARSECDEAIHVSACGAMDCFASLATTIAGDCAQKPRGPYAVRATGLRLRGRFGCTASGPCRSANSSGLISAAGFGGLNK